MVFVFDPWSYHVLEETLGHVAPIFPGKKGGGSWRSKQQNSDVLLENKRGSNHCIGIIT